MCTSKLKVLDKVLCKYAGVKCFNNELKRHMQKAAAATSLLVAERSLYYRYCELLSYTIQNI